MKEPWRTPWLAALLSPLAWLWRGAAGLNRGLWRSGLRRPHRFPVPVISVGNLSVGGTGKTPAVSLILDQLPEALRPALVLSRGYGANFSLDGHRGNDEFHLLRRRHPEALFALGSDRVAAAAPHFAGERTPACVILDDGAQHRRVARDLELLLFDLRQLLGRHRSLPAGPWREPLAVGREADLVLVTGIEGAKETELLRARERLRASGYGGEILAAEHRPRDLSDLDGREGSSFARLKGRRIGLLVGIARPERVRATLRGLGAEVVWTIALPDHRAFPRDLEARVASKRAEAPVDLLLTTEKDVPKLVAGGGAGADWAVLRVDLALVEEGAPARLEALLQSLVTLKGA
jgi:tetraacyldisaccharide 4'-kinase